MTVTALTSTRAMFIMPATALIPRATWSRFMRMMVERPLWAATAIFYFRVDLHDLKAYAEQGNLDIYVAINFGTPAPANLVCPIRSIPARR